MKHLVTPWLGLFLLLLPACGGGPPTISLGERTIPYAKAGQGEPSVVFLSDWLIPMREWASIQEQVARMTTTLAYDRGRAAATDGQERSPDRVVNELDQIIAAVQLPRPLVLVGHGVGGVYARLYAAAHPQDVAALVLVDAPGEDWDHQVSEMLSKKPYAQYVQRQAYLFNTKWTRSEYLHIDEAYDRLRSGGSSLPETVKLTVVSAGLPKFSPYLPESNTEAWKAFYEMQGRLAELTPDHRWVIARQSGHNIPEEQPDVIVEAISDVLSGLRRPPETKTSDEEKPEQIEFHDIDDLLAVEE